MSDQKSIIDEILDRAKASLPSETVAIEHVHLAALLSVVATAGAVDMEMRLRPYNPDSERFKRLRERLNILHQPYKK